MFVETPLGTEYNIIQNIIQNFKVIGQTILEIKLNYKKQNGRSVDSKTASGL